MEMSSTKNRLLVVATAGGKPNAEPLLEIAKILNTRGYSIEFATLEGQEKWADKYPFISKVHILGPGVAPAVQRASYARMMDWKAPRLFNDCQPLFDAKMFLESSWPSVYSSLSVLMQDRDARPDFILADYLVDAVIDMHAEYRVPIAMHWPQMPTGMLPASYVPGIPGLQVDVLSSENATLWQRLQNELVKIHILPWVIKYYWWRRKMRARAGVTRSLPSGPKPSHLVLVNTFFAVDTPKDLPSNVAPIGPIMQDEYPHLTEPCLSFIEKHKKIIYVAFGTHILLQDKLFRQIMDGLLVVLQNRVADGVIWSIGGTHRKHLANGCDRNMLFVNFAPQRAVLAHPHTRAFISHAGRASTNEAVFHGVPVVSVAIYFDQLQNAMRLHDAGVGIPLDKHDFNADDLANAVTQVVKDSSGDFRHNCLRLKAIARIASRRKHSGADLIEEVLADHEGRHVDSVCKRPMHLQTADVRMPVWKAKNWDLYAIAIVASGLFALSTRVLVNWFY
ncbi:predicted protein [Uncinocarpus reesii 1704]|uniref:Uncharacterized protein n=1 Tax=Uncinocarpus reesii (strain UAMH 1704) TaxID=336963 RepID=C4JU60_UNCRE|nr:uncharacterized protein UREG_05999 [Uncinocarpus reesii 1704]EEP81157.1 predicted protein [Uncinocarpus reesii 1704]